MIQIIDQSELPENIKFSEHTSKHCKKALALCYLGTQYFVPLTEDMQSYIKKNKKFLSNLEDWLRFAIGSLHSQIRIMEIKEVHNDLSNQIKDGLEKMYSQQLFNEIQKRIPIENKPSQHL